MLADFELFAWFDYFSLVEKLGWFLKFRNLNFVDLANNKLTQIYERMFQACPNARIIKLSENKIATVDKNAFVGLSCLEKLDLSKNLIEHIDPTTFENLPQIRHLSLDGNVFERFEIVLFQFHVIFRSKITLLYLKKSLHKTHDFNNKKKFKPKVIYSKSSQAELIHEILDASCES